MKSEIALRSDAMKLLTKNLDEIRLVTTFPTERRRGKFHD